MSISTKVRVIAICVLVAGVVATALGVILPFATGAYEGPGEQHPPATTTVLQTPVGAEPPMTAPGPGQGAAPAPPPSIDTTNLDLITAGGPLAVCLFNHNVFPAGDTNDDPTVPFNGYPDAGAAFAQFRNDVIREQPDQVLEVYSEGQAAGTPGAGPIVIVVPQGSALTAADAPTLAAGSAKATAAYEHLVAAGVEFQVSAHALGPMTEICSLQEQVSIFGQAQVPGDGTTENPGFSAYHSLDVQAGALRVSTLPEYAEPLRQSLATVGDAFIVTDDGEPISDAVG